MPISLSPLAHIEISVRDAEAAYRFLNQVFGARKVQEGFIDFLQSQQLKFTYGNEKAREEFDEIMNGAQYNGCHVGLGDVVFQFIEPLKGKNSWAEQITKTGPGVHNLTFGVDDMRETVNTLAGEGITPLFSFPLDWARLYGEENVKDDAQPVYMMDSMAKLGFHLELFESALKEHLDDPAAPKYVTGENELIGPVSPMLHIELTTEDAEGTLSLLTRAFGSKKVEEDFANFLDSPFMRIIHMNLSNVVLQYCQPLAELGSWYEQLKARGPSVHNITFMVDDIDDTMKKIEEAGAMDLFTFPLDWAKLVGEENARPDSKPVHMVDTMDILGFHLELAERPVKDGANFDILFTDYK